MTYHPEHDIAQIADAEETFVRFDEHKRKVIQAAINAACEFSVDVPERAKDWVADESLTRLGFTREKLGGYAFYIAVVFGELFDDEMWATPEMQDAIREKRQAEEYLGAHGVES